jgi:hypothetical protein
MASEGMPRLLIVLGGGMPAGTLDNAFDCIDWALTANVTAARDIQSVAAGIRGKASSKWGRGQRCARPGAAACIGR